MRYLIIVLSAICFSPPAIAERLNPEAWYQAQWCGQSPRRLSDGTFVDCIKDGRAVEIDFADKFYEGIGQAVHYARVLDMMPGVALIIEQPHECRFWDRLRVDAQWLGHGFTVWKIGPAAEACD